MANLTCSYSIYSRRVNKSVGRSKASSGRRPKKVLVIDDDFHDEGKTYHEGPPLKKKRTNKSEHNLSKAIRYITLNLTYM